MLTRCGHRSRVKSSHGILSWNQAIHLKLSGQFFFFFLLDVVYSVLRLFKTMYVLCVVCYIHVGMYVYRLYIIDDFRPVVHGTHSNSFRFFSFSGFRAPVRFSRPDRRRTRGGGEGPYDERRRDRTRNFLTEHSLHFFFFFLGGGERLFLGSFG